MEEIINITIVENDLNLLNDFKEHLVESKKTYNVSCFDNINKNYLPAIDDRTIYFYEFSNTSNEPKKFEKVSEFMEWAKECGIYLSSYTIHELKTHETSYAACYNGSVTLAVRHGFDELKKALDYNSSINTFNGYDPRCYCDEYWDNYWD